MYTIQVLDASGNVKQSASGPDFVRFLYTQPYEQGDTIAFFADEQHCILQVDQSVPEAMVYLPGKQLYYRIPKGDFALAYAPQAFAGDMHILQIRPARKEELSARRNLALNPADQRFYEGCYPHATASIETRDEPVFFARNVIDGLKFNESHGGWPYLSWGIGNKDDAEITLHFGRTVRIDEVGITLRADFPHDSWWEKATLTFSDGQILSLSLVKTDATQYFHVGEHLADWVRLSDLKRADDPSPFPALTQWEVFGQEIL